MTWITIDDVRLFFSETAPQHMQTKTNNLVLMAETTSPRVRNEKIKAMCTYNKQHDKIKLNGEELEDIAKLHLSGQYHHSHWRYEGRYREPNKESQAGIPP